MFGFLGSAVRLRSRYSRASSSRLSKNATMPSVRRIAALPGRSSSALPNETAAAWKSPVLCIVLYPIAICANGSDSSSASARVAAANAVSREKPAPGWFGKPIAWALAIRVSARAKVGSIRRASRARLSALCSASRG